MVKNLLIENNNNIRTVQSESSAFSSLLFDQGFPGETQRRLNGGSEEAEGN